MCIVTLEWRHNVWQHNDEILILALMCTLVRYADRTQSCVADIGVFLCHGLLLPVMLHKLSYAEDSDITLWGGWLYEGVSAYGPETVGEDMVEVRVGSNMGRGGHSEGSVSFSRWRRAQAWSSLGWRPPRAPEAVHFSLELFLRRIPSSCIVFSCYEGMSYLLALFFLELSLLHAGFDRQLEMMETRLLWNL